MFELRPKQTMAFESGGTEVLYGGAAGGGKLLALDTPIPTDCGWTTMGGITVGEKVFDERGVQCCVVGKSEVETEGTFEVEFSDGCVIVAGSRHQWVTSTIVERTRMLRATPEFRKKRRASRSSRVSGRKSASFTTAIQERNVFKADPGPLAHCAIRTTREIFETLRIKGRINHSVRVAGPLELPETELLVDPYVLGAWLGDGTSVSGQVTGKDEEVFLSIANAGYMVVPHAKPISRGVHGLKVKLRMLGLLGNKHIPHAYLRASKDQRTALLQGLMDTDGTCDQRGHPSFCTTSEKLRTGMLELLHSLGIKASASEGQAKLNGVVVSKKFTLHFLTDIPCFRIARKLIRQKRSGWRGTHERRYIVDVRPVPHVPMQCIEVDSPSHCYLAGSTMVPTHNSYLKRVSAIRWCQQVGGIQVYLFRRTLPDLRDNHLRGPTSFHVMLEKWVRAGTVKYRSVENEFEFANGSVLHLCYCDSENDVEKYRGAEIHVLLIDELTHFSEYQYRFLRSRVRIAGLRVPEEYRGRLPRIETASNPGSIGHAWVKRTFITPKPALEVWRCQPEEGGMLRQFIPARLSDNPYLTQDDPSYADRLRGLGSDNLVRAMLDGDWDIIAGQAFEKLRREKHSIDAFDPPDDWLVFGALDWGSTRPFSFGQYTVANGNALPDGRMYPRGAIIRYGEWYGWTGKANEGKRLEVADVAEGIAAKWGGRRPGYIAADPSMWKVDGGPSHAETMLKKGVTLRKADNSRLTGYLSVRDRIAGDEDGPMLYVTKNCHDGFWRTMPDIVMDERHPEDVDTDQEDHCYDEVRYACMSRPWMSAAKKVETLRLRDYKFDEREDESWRTA